MPPRRTTERAAKFLAVKEQYSADELRSWFLLAPSTLLTLYIGQTLTIVLAMLTVAGWLLFETLGRHRQKVYVLWIGLGLCSFSVLPALVPHLRLSLLHLPVFTLCSASLLVGWY